MRFRQNAWLIAILALSACSEHHQPAPLIVTYIANTGFLIECQDQKILIDALFGGFESDWCYVPSDSVVDLMVNARPPFDDIDLIAVTHCHVDHFNADMVANHLRHNRSGILVCPGQVAQELSKCANYAEVQDRMRSISVPMDSSVTMKIAGVEVNAIRTLHSPYYEQDEATGESVDRHRDVEHLEFVFSIAGRVIYHSGDARMNDVLRYESYGFGKNPIDLALVQWWDAREKISFRQTLIRNVIRPDRVILMHMFPNRPPLGHPEQKPTTAREVIVPQRSMQRWTF